MEINSRLVCSTVIANGTVTLHWAERKRIRQPKKSLLWLFNIA